MKTQIKKNQRKQVEKGILSKHILKPGYTVLLKLLTKTLLLLLLLLLCTRSIAK